MPELALPVKNRREMQFHETREALIDAATQLFVKQGFGATSLAGIASAAGATRGAAYHHFEDKAALYEAVMERFGARAVEAISSAAAGGEDAWHGALLAIDAFLEQCCDHEYARIVWREGPTALGWDRWRACEARYGLGLTHTLIDTLLAERILTSPAPPDMLARVAFAMIGEAGMRVAETKAGKSQQQARCEALELLEQLLSGLRATDRP